MLHYFVVVDAITDEYCIDSKGAFCTKLQAKAGIGRNNAAPAIQYRQQ